MKRVRNSLIPEVHEDLFVANGSQRLRQMLRFAAL